MDDRIGELEAEVRGRLLKLLEQKQPTRETALLLAQIEEERDRHEGAVAGLARRASELASGVVSMPGEFLDRPNPVDVDPRASKPWQQQPVTEAQAARGVVFAYTTANPAFYRAVIDRLRPGEKVRNVSNHGTYEYGREEFLATLPEIARTASYRTGTPSAPGSCRYTTGSPSAAMKVLLAPD